jgi:hypothetical protein
MSNLTAEVFLAELTFEMSGSRGSTRVFLTIPDGEYATDPWHMTELGVQVEKAALAAVVEAVKRLADEGARSIHCVVSDFDLAPAVDSIQKESGIYVRAGRIPWPSAIC